MSLNCLGLSHQLSSPITETHCISELPEASSSSNQDILQDRKDVLVERLNDLLARLSDENDLDDDDVSLVHTGVDRIESVLRIRAKGKPRRSSMAGERNIEVSSPSERSEDSFWEPSTPTRSFSMHLPGSAPSSPHKTPFQHIHSSLSLSAPPRLTSTRFNEVAKTAEDLAQLLTTTLAELEMRKKESTHIRDILVMKLGIATERNKRLEKQVADLEERQSDCHAHLRYLRIQLQAIEVKTSHYVSNDEELDRSILNWKADWETRAKGRKRMSSESARSAALTGFKDGSQNHVANGLEIGSPSWYELVRRKDSTIDGINEL